MPSGLEGSKNGDSSLRERKHEGRRAGEREQVGEGIPTETLTKSEEAGGLANSQVF